MTELSEGGLRLAPVAGAPTTGARVTGVMYFSDGACAHVAGTVKGTVGAVVVVLTLGVELPRMLAEQRRILLAYPDFLRAEA